MTHIQKELLVKQHLNLNELRDLSFDSNPLAKLVLYLLESKFSLWEILLSVHQKFTFFNVVFDSSVLILQEITN
jgi:hypothetical protein